jgi:Ca2+-binding EF-hand superfamily protein
MLSRIKVLGIGVLCCAAATFAVAQNQAGKATNPGGENAPRFDAARFLKDHDKNNDGKLSKDELPPAVQDEFKQIDTNNDGFVTQEELQKHAQALSHRRPQLVEVFFYAIDIPEEGLTTKELQATYDQLRKLDKNNDGKIDENEVKAFRDQRRKERIDHVFDALDKNKDGKISKDEARGFWADDFAQLDTNKDGMLDKQEVEAATSHKAGHALGAGGKNPGQQGKQ